MTSKTPVPDRAEHNAYFPSEYSLTQYTAPKSDFDGAQHEQVTAGPRKVLMIASDERYLRVADGKYFSTGNHPLEMLLPLMHLEAAGYQIEIATLSGNMAKLELWAMPGEDDAVKTAYEHFRPQLEEPLVLSEAVKGLSPDEYAAVFVPGGHGANIGIPHSADVKDALKWALDNDRFVITLCHGPSCLLSATENGKNLFAGYEACVFPDYLDKGPNVEIGYLPGQLDWVVAGRLTEEGLTVVNDDMTGQVHQDRKLLTGDSPLASNALGNLAVKALGEFFGAKS